MNADDKMVKLLGDALTFRFTPNLEVAEEQAAWLESTLTGKDAVDFDLRDHARTRKLLANSIKSALDVAQAQTVRIGVSSGLDSRALLGALNDCFDMKRVFVFTYGHEGNQDYENAEALFGKSVINQELHNYYEKDKFERIVLKGDVSDEADMHVIGHMGDPIAGSHIKSVEGPKDWKSACTEFINWQIAYPQFLKRGWMPEGYDPVNSLPASPLMSAEVLHYDDQLDFIIRQHQRSNAKAGTVDERNLPLTGFKSVEEANHGILAPFCMPKIMSCFLNTPREHRFNKRAYKDFLYTSYPDFFPDLAADDPYIIAKGSTNVELTHIWKSDKELRNRFQEKFGKLNKLGFEYDFEEFSDLIAGGDRVAAKFVQGLGKAVRPLAKVQ